MLIRLWERLGLARSASSAPSWRAEGPTEPIPFLSEALASEAARALVADAVAPAAPVAGLIRADAILKASVDARTKVLLDAQAARSASEGEPGVACARGCFHCCRNSVSAFPFEAFAVADHVEKTWSGPRRWALKRRIRAYEKAAARLRRGEPHPWCPFLQDGACSVYAVRPTACRVHHSTDLQACRRDVEALPPGTQPFYDAVFPLYRGVYEALGDRGGFPLGLDLALAVGIALRDPDALRRFLDGGNPLLRAAKRRTRRRWSGRAITGRVRK